MARRFGGLVVAGADATGTTTRRLGDLGTDPAVAADRVIVEIGSVTKVFTATLLCVLAGRGTVRLDTPVDDLLPTGVAMPRIARPVTLADLAAHTSGLPRLPPGWIRGALRHRDNPYTGFTLDDLWTATSRRRGRRAPGRVRYSNYGAGLLGHLLERATGTGYADLVTREICQPLGLTDTTITVPEADRPRLAPGHTRRGRPTPGWDFPVLTAAGALHSTAADLLTLLRAQWPTDPDAATPSPDTPSADTALGRALHATHTPRARDRIAVGLGWIIGPDDLLWHNGGTGGYRSYVAVHPTRHRAVVVLANSAQPVDSLGTLLATTEQLHPTIHGLHHPR